MENIEEKKLNEIPSLNDGVESLLPNDKNDFGASGTSLIDSNEGLFGNTEENGGSLLGSVADTASFVEINNDVMSEEEIEIRKRFFMDPKNQADILFENYVREHPIKLNRQQKRKAYSQFLKNAKNGLYKKVFSEQIYGISKEKSEKDFGKLN